MAKKKLNINLKISYDAPVTLTFVIVCVILFLLNTYVIKNGAVGKVLASPTSTSGSFPFIVSQPLSYLRLFLYIFGSDNILFLFSNLYLIMLLGPAMEERYGSVIIGIMIFVSALFSGVLNACFSSKSLIGALPVASMILFLNVFNSFLKKKLPLSFVLIIALFVSLEAYCRVNAIHFIICMAGGLCGSLFALLTSPKTRQERKTAGSASGNSSAKKKGGLLNKAEKLAYAEELDRNSPRNKTSGSRSDDETTVVGTLKF